MPRGKAYFYLRRWKRVYYLVSVPWKGICVIKMWDMVPVGQWLGNPTYEWEYPSMKKKGAKGGGELGKHLAAMESRTFDGLLPLVEHCCVRQYDDGDPREPGWFTIKTTGAAWVCQVKDPDSCCSFSAVADTLDKALETAALLLSCDEAPWELDKFLVDAAARKKKK